MQCHVCLLRSYGLRTVHREGERMRERENRHVMYVFAQRGKGKGKEGGSLGGFILEKDRHLSTSQQQTSFLHSLQTLYSRHQHPQLLLRHASTWIVRRGKERGRGREGGRERGRHTNDSSHLSDITCQNLNFLLCDIR
jgi:hypothetical protein